MVQPPSNPSTPDNKSVEMGKLGKTKSQVNFSSETSGHENSRVTSGDSRDSTSTNGAERKSNSGFNKSIRRGSKMMGTISQSTKLWIHDHIAVGKFNTQKKSQFTDVFSNLLIIGIMFGALTFILGEDHMTPGGGMFTLSSIWFFSMLTGFVFDSLGLPPLLGMLVSGIVLKNVKYIDGVGDIASSLPNSWSEGIRASGLSVILMRSGLELDIPAVKKAGLAAIRLTCLPGMMEALAVGLSSTVIFGMPWALGMALGFILAAVSPAVVVVGMFNLQKNGFGVKKGIPSLVVAAASFDDVVAISGFSIAIGFAIHNPDHTLTMTLLHGPLEIVFGVSLGLMGGAIMSCTKVWNKRWKRTIAIFGIGMAFMFGMLHAGFSGAGAMAGLIMGMVGSVCWRAGIPHALAKKGDEHYIHHAESDLALIWQMACQPLLFGVIGTSLDFGLIPSETIPKSILVVFIGLCFRLPMAYFATYGKGMTTHERGFVALSWIPKATVQAALCSVPLQIIRDNLHDTDSDYEDYEKWGFDILTTAVLSILMTAPLGLFFIQILGPRWLNNDFLDDAIEEELSSEEAKANTSDPTAETSPSITRRTRTDSGNTPFSNADPNVDLKQVMEDKIEAIDIILKRNAAALPNKDRQDSQNFMYELKKLAEVCIIENGGTKVLDTAGNFFKVANRDGADMYEEAKKQARLRTSKTEEEIKAIEKEVRDSGSIVSGKQKTTFL